MTPRAVFRRTAIVWLCCAAAALAGCQREQANDATGTRIVSLSPAATVMLRDLGLVDHLVGRHGFDTIAPASLPVVGDQTGIDYERLLLARPTHIVAEWGLRQIPERLASLASERGIQIIPIETLTLDQIDASFRRIAGAFERPVGVSPLGSLRASRPPAVEAGRVLLVVGTSPTVDCLGPGSAHAQILDRLGHRAAIGTGAPWMVLSLEDIIGLDPDTIVLVQPSFGPDAASGDIEDRLGPLAEAGIRAVRTGRVALIDDPLALIPSTNLAAFAEALEARLVAMGPLPSPREHDDAHNGPG